VPNTSQSPVVSRRHGGTITGTFDSNRRWRDVARPKERPQIVTGVHVSRAPSTFSITYGRARSPRAVADVGDQQRVVVAAVDVVRHAVALARRRGVDGVEVRGVP
jgi:hypothetical protein